LEVLQNPGFGRGQGWWVWVTKQDIDTVGEHLSGDLTASPAGPDDSDSFEGLHNGRGPKALGIYGFWAPLEPIAAISD
jgi:hypothetical protein